MKKKEYKVTAPLLLCCAAVTACQQEAKQPNIIIMIADDISASDFGCYGNPIVKTPNIDRLANEGLLFTNAILSTSSSSPSRCSIITGRYPHNTGACELHSPMGAEQVTIPQVLQEAGYYTAQAGKWHFGDVPGGIRTHFDASGKGKVKEDGDSGSAQWVKRLRERPADKPFFMWLASFDAHRPWDGDDSMPRYDESSLEISEFYVDTPQTREDLASYYYEVSRFDRSVGEVVQELKDQGIYDDTMIIVMADNGRPFPRAKTRLIMEGIRTPLIIHYPKLIKDKGSKCNSLLSVIDIAPTVAELAGANISDTFQGRSFLNLLSSPSSKFRNYAFAEHNWHDYEAYERMVCTENYLLIENSRPELNAEGAIDIMGGGTGRSLMQAYAEGRLNPKQADIFTTPRPNNELYLYKKDTKQLENLSGADSKDLSALLDILHQWQKQTLDDCPDDLTQDWYSRETLEAYPIKETRGTMPGSRLKATFCKDGGPF